jgi:hypothetical protein
MGWLVVFLMKAAVAVGSTGQNAAEITEVTVCSLRLLH